MVAYREPVETCRNVPRDDEVCKQVPVIRLVPKCQETERVLCEAVPYQQEVQRCQLTNSPVCVQQEAGEGVRRSCTQVPTQVCTLGSPEQVERCGERAPRRLCETRLIPVSRSLQRVDCGPGDSQDIIPYSRDFYTTKFL